MSMRALLLATRDQIRAEAGLEPEECEIMLDGRPTPSAGALFVAVHEGTWNDVASNGLSLHEGFGVSVTVTMRSGDVPPDRLGPDLLCRKGGLLDQCEKIRALIHEDPDDSPANAVRWRANEIIGDTVNAFLEPLQFQGAGPSQMRGGQWFWAENKDELAGVSKTLTFGQATRVQKIEEQG